MRILYCNVILLIVFGVCMFVGGVAIQFLMTHLVSTQADDMVPLKSDDSAMFQPWVDHGGYGSPIYNKFHIWNLTNHEEVLKGGIPKVERVGPFVYRMFDWRENVQWSGENISFTYHNYNVFLPERTNANLSRSARVVVPNFALQGVMTAIQQAVWSGALKPLEADLVYVELKHQLKIHNVGLFLFKTVNEVLFGYHDPILAWLITVLKRFNMPIPAGMSSFIGLQSIDTPAFYATPSVQYNGINDYKRTAQFRSWCGNEDLSKYWKHAPELAGSDGWQFPPSPAKVEKLFIDSLIVVVTLEDVGKQDFQGIHTHRYELQQTLWKNDSQFGMTHYNYAPFGLLNLTSVQGASMFASKPYFLDADDFYHRQVDMPPADRARDDTAILVERITGDAVAAWERIQVNIQFENSLCLNLGSEDGPVPNDCFIGGEQRLGRFIPVFFMEQIVEVPPSEADLLKGQIYGTPKMYKTIGWIVFALSFAVAVWVAFLFRHIRHHKRKLKSHPFSANVEQGEYKPVDGDSSDSDSE
eukprot:TRINITY_DN30587_c0_g1_i1.p1 TRINITY_DN30587_c0_g1~~TRINITY_DN30587_c0_g1_i1.p1  ORF type:complete len:527 (+),score=84.68 TRINITY_DN30587_c0_g1_i1:54-1634(+)